MPEQNHDRTAAGLHALNLLLLTSTAGTLDGLTYLRAHVFTANMTGNVVLLGVHLAERDLANAERSAISLGAFAAGAVLGAITILPREEAGRPVATMGLSIESLLLVIFAVLYAVDKAGNRMPLQAALISTAALALAVQSVTVRRLHVSGVATTFITGTITSAMVALVRTFRERHPSQDKSETEHAALLISMLVVYLASAMLAVVLDSHWTFVPAVMPAVVVLIVLWRSRNVPLT